MKLYLTSSLLCLLTSITFSLYGQTQQLITVVKLKNGSAFIESKKISESIFGGDKTESSQGKYWITSQTNISLQAGLKKAASWATLNEDHKKEFEKEIVRIRVTDKDTYEFYRKYIPEFSTEAILSFQGHEDGTFTLTLSVTKDVAQITLTTKDGVNNFIKLLQGKSVNNDVDEIFN